MKKLFYIILFSLCICSCSKDDDDIYEQPEDISIMGTWKDKDYGETFIFYENEVEIITEKERFYLEYIFTGKDITFIEYEYNDNSYEISYYKKKIKEIEKEVKTAGGKRKSELLDQLITIQNLLDKAYSNQKIKVATYFSDVEFTGNELSFGIGKKEYDLTRINE